MPDSVGGLFRIHCATCAGLCSVRFAPKGCAACTVLCTLKTNSESAIYRAKQQRVNKTLSAYPIIRLHQPLPSFSQAHELCSPAPENDGGRSNSHTEVCLYDHLKSNSIPDERNFRPKTLEDFIGQGDSKKTLRLMLDSAHQRSATLEHVVFYGRPGLGKTPWRQSSPPSRIPSILEMVSSS